MLKFELIQLRLNNVEMLGEYPRAYNSNYNGIIRVDKCARNMIIIMMKYDVRLNKLCCIKFNTYIEIK
jgi:hypothetical protein